ncbi:MAG: hypothetical protein WA688_06475 [Thermoplasmata archaeon]
MTEATLEMSRCGSCHAEFLPRPGACPRCGSYQIDAISLPALGIVRAATELAAPARGWSAPHRLALVEIAEGIRLLCVASGPLPTVGDSVRIGRDGTVYRVR